MNKGPENQTTPANAAQLRLLSCYTYKMGQIEGGNADIIGVMENSAKFKWFQLQDIEPRIHVVLSNYLPVFLSLTDHGMGRMDTEMLFEVTVTFPVNNMKRNYKNMQNDYKETQIVHDETHIDDNKM